MVLADIDAQGMATVEVQLRALGATVMSVITDVGSLESVEALRDAVYDNDEFGECAFLFNNAGLAVGRSSYLSTMAEWKLSMDVNVWGVIHGLHAFVPSMLEQVAGGRVVSTSSLAGLMNSSPETGVPYVVAKHGVTLMMEALQHELRSQVAESAEQEVVAHLLHPGIVRTNIGSNSAAAAEREGVDISAPAIGGSPDCKNTPQLRLNFLPLRGCLFLPAGSGMKPVSKSEDTSSE